LIFQLNQLMADDQMSQHNSIVVRTARCNIGKQPSEIPDNPYRSFPLEYEIEKDIYCSLHLGACLALPIVQPRHDPCTELRGVC
jgi:hypothetical protein